MAELTIIIITFRRPALLEKALRSCLAQAEMDPATFEIVVVDNCPDQSAATVTQGIAAEAPGRVRYVPEPAPGISTARNAGVRAAQTDLIAFLDDDNEAAPRWLVSLLRTQREHGADAVFGPVLARLAMRPPRHAEFFERYFSRQFDLPDGANITGRHAYLGTGNSLFRRSTCFPNRSDPFEVSLGMFGGEDSLLLKQMFCDGRRLFWSREALVYENVEAQRVRVAYVCKRRFRNGQSRSEACAMVARPRWLEVMQWMLVGLVQFFGWGLVAVLLAPTRTRLSVRAMTTAAAGLGKVMWMRPFKLALYRRPDPHRAAPSWSRCSS